VVVSATDALGNTTSSPPTTITVVARAPKITNATIKAPAPLRLKALRRGGWRVQATVTLSTGTNVTVRLSVISRTIAATRRNVPDGRTPIFMTIPKGYHKKGTFTLTLRIAGVDVQTVTFRVR
jgi:hypothetical protein